MRTSSSLFVRAFPYFVAKACVLIKHDFVRDSTRRRTANLASSEPTVYAVDGSRSTITQRTARATERHRSPSTLSAVAWILQEKLGALKSAGLFLASILAAVASPVLAQAQTPVYGYDWAGTTYPSIDHLEAAIRSNAGYHNAELAFPIISNGSWELDYRPLGALGLPLAVPPQTISQPYFAINKNGWPPTTPPPGYCNGATNVYTACQNGPYKWCDTIEKEIARFSCQINEDIAANGTYVMQPGYPAQGGAYPAPVVQNDINPNFTSPATDPAGLGRRGGMMTYQVPQVDCTFSSCPNIPFVSVRYDTAASSPASQTGLGHESVLATYSNAWGVRRAQFFWCPPGMGIEGSPGEPCSDSFKVSPFPKLKTPKQHDQCTDGNPCAPGNGNKEQSEEDIVTANVSLVRHYNSLRELRSYSFFDLNWHHSYSQRVLVGGIIGNHSTPNQDIQLVQNERGHAEAFRRVTGNEYRSTVQSDVVMFKTTSPTAWVIVYPSGRVERYDEYGRIRRIENAGDSSKNLDITYVIESGAGNTGKWDFYAVDTVKDISGRGIRFIYDSSIYVNARVSEIREIGTEIALANYTYDSVLGRLWKVTTGSGTREYLYAEAGYVTSTSIFKRHLTGIVDELGVRYGSYTYDAWGRVKISTHPGDAGKVSITYNSDSQVTVERPEGNVTYHYRAADAFRRPSATNNPQGFVQSILNAEDASCLVSDERVCKTIDRRGVTTKFDYNNLFRTATTEALGTASQRRALVDRFGADKLYQRSRFRVQDAAGTAETDVAFTRNTRGQLLTITEQPADVPSSKWRTTTITYCELADVNAGTCPVVGILKSVDGPRTDVADSTTYFYRLADAPACSSMGALHDCPYRKGDLWKSQNSLGQVVEYVSRDGGGRILREKDSNGVFTDYIYHARGWLNDKIVRSSLSGLPSPEDATTSYDYDGVGNVKKVTQPDGSYQLFSYDDAHRLIRAKDNYDNEIEYCQSPTSCLDQAGNRRFERTKDPNGTLVKSLRRTFHSAFPTRLWSVVNASNQTVETIPGGSNSADKGYDGNGNVILSWDGLGVWTRREYDPLNRLAKLIQDTDSVQDPSTQNTTTEYAYDARDNLRSVKDPGTVGNPLGLTTAYTYDGLNDLTAQQSPDTGITGFTYDLAGNRITQTDARGVQSTYGYDALNRLTTITYPTSALNVAFFYDQPNRTTQCAGSFPLGRLTRITDASGSTTFCYDRRGNVTRKTQVTAGVTQSIATTWTKADRVETITYPSGGVVTYARNTIGQINGISWKANAGATAITLVGNATYYPFGPLNVLTWGNGRTLTKAYDSNYAIDSVASSDPNGLKLDLTTDVMGNITEARDAIGIATPTRKYQYDRLYRLKQVDDGANALQEGFGYTKTGDRTQKTLPGQSPQIYAYLAGTHHLVSVGGVARTYDDNGNTTSLPTTPYPLVYNDRNRLASIEFIGLGSNTTVSYAHNGRGERVRKLTSSSSETNTQTALYDEGGRLLRTQTIRTCSGGGGEVGRPGLGSNDLIACGGSRTEEIVYLDDVPIAQVTDGAISYLETDYLGTPRVAVNPTTNAWQWKWSYFGSAFGEHAATKAQSEGIDVSLRYPGQQYDADAGIHYNYFRDYDPMTGRYLESDPIGLGGGISTYAYTNQNPLVGIDRYGLFCIPLPDEKTDWRTTRKAENTRAEGVALSGMFSVTCKFIGAWHIWQERERRTRNFCRECFYVYQQCGWPRPDCQWVTKVGMWKSEKKDFYEDAYTQASTWSANGRKCVTCRNPFTGRAIDACGDSVEGADDLYK